MFSPYFLVLVFGLIGGCCVVVIILIVFLARHLSKNREQPYEVETSVRIVAFLIDIYIISIIYLILQSVIIIVSTGSITHLAYLFPSILFQAAYNVLNFLFYSFPLLFQVVSNPLYILSLQNIFNIFLPYIISFLYFFIIEIVLKGKTLGKMIFRVKSVSMNNRSLKYHEVLINSLGKSFFWWLDLIIGLIVLASEKKPDGALIKSKQIRLMQRLAGVVVIRTPKHLPY